MAGPGAAGGAGGAPATSKPFASYLTMDNAAMVAYAVGVVVAAILFGSAVAAAIRAGSIWAGKPILAALDCVARPVIAKVGTAAYATISSVAVAAVSYYVGNRSYENFKVSYATFMKP